jgi:hypothetical protein
MAPGAHGRAMGVGGVQRLRHSTPDALAAFMPAA